MPANQVRCSARRRKFEPQRGKGRKEKAKCHKYALCALGVFAVQLPFRNAVESGDGGRGILEFMNEDIRIALVEDDAPFRQSLQLLIDGSPGFLCVGGWSMAETALRRPELGSADVVLLDLHLPGMDGDAAVSLILEQHPSLLVLMFTAHDDDDRVFACLCRGACGYLLKSTTPARLLEAIREAVDGGSPMSPSIARKVVRLFRENMREPVEHHQLTPREVELLSALSSGHSYQSSASNLGITVNTVRSHIRSIYEKLKVHSQSEAVSKALRAGLI